MHVWWKVKVGFVSEFSFFYSNSRNRPLGENQKTYISNPLFLILDKDPNQHASGCNRYDPSSALPHFRCTFLVGPQPMFNVMRVREGRVEDFKRFLVESEQRSLKYNTPVSVGPYLDSDLNTYLYVTHYASTKAFLQVMMSLTFSGLATLRASCTEATSWTYCNPESFEDLGRDNIIMVGVQGDVSSFQSMLNTIGVQPTGTIKSIKNVRSHSLGNYFIFRSNKTFVQELETFIQQGGAIVIYRATNTRK